MSTRLVRLRKKRGIGVSCVCNVGLSDEWHNSKSSGCEHDPSARGGEWRVHSRRGGRWSVGFIFLPGNLDFKILSYVSTLHNGSFESASNPWSCTGIRNKSRKDADVACVAASWACRAFVVIVFRKHPCLSGWTNIGRRKANVESSRIHRTPI